VQLTVTRSDLDQTKGQLDQTKRTLASVQQDLVAAQSDLSDAKDWTRQAVTVSDELNTCLHAVLDGALDAFTWNDSKKDQCINALDGNTSLMDSPTVASTTT
jgi:chromosome segregation ATPase